MRIVFAGTPEVAVPSLQALLDSDHDVVAVVTRPDAPAGRGRGLQPSTVRVLADREGLEVLTPARASEEAFLERLRELGPDVCAVVAYGALLRPAALQIPRHGWINLHFSLLPAWRGAAPVQHAVIAGDQVTGACTFRIEEGLDTGPVIDSITETIRPDDTSGSLLQRLSQSGAPLLVRSVDAIAAGTAVFTAQGHDGVTLAPKLGVDDARVRWSDPAAAVDRRIRGCTPAPGAWTMSRDLRLRLGPVQIVEPETVAADQWPGERPGDLRAGKRQVLVRTGDHGLLALGSVQAPGKKAMNAADWARGLRLDEGYLQ